MKRNRNLAEVLLAGVLLAAAPGSLAAQQGVLRPSDPVRAGRGWEQTYKFETPTRPGMTLKVRTDLGSIRVRTSEQDSVRVRVVARVGSRSSQGAQRALERVRILGRAVRGGVVVTGEVAPRDAGPRAWLHLAFEIEIPRRYNVSVETKAGGIEIGVLDGQVRAVTAGGNVSLEDVTGRVNVRTAGGNIRLGNTGDRIDAVTAGGMIQVGNVAGDARLETSGGFIVGGRIEGAVTAVTAGGDIILESAGRDVEARTMGGQIFVGEAGGALRAQTAGGSVIVVGGRGGANVETAGGSIDLMEIRGPVRAVTREGRIFVLIEAEQSEFGESELETAHGNVTVYLPERLALTIEAKIEGAYGHRIRSDFPLKIQGGQVRTVGTVRGRGEINGGGEVLRIRTIGGDIRIIKITGAQRGKLRRKSEALRRKIVQVIQRHAKLRIKIEQTGERDERDDDRNRDHNHDDNQNHRR